MITIAIVEDDKEYRSQYRDYLKQMEAQMGMGFWKITGRTMTLF